ncbi:MAG: hypothetical protein PSY14_10735 [bacterium]|nr:hypothetical protein [bacterium]
MDKKFFPKRALIAIFSVSRNAEWLLAFDLALLLWYSVFAFFGLGYFWQSVINNCVNLYTSSHQIENPYWAGLLIVFISGAIILPLLLRLRRYVILALISIVFTVALLKWVGPVNFVPVC